MPVQITKSMELVLKQTIRRKAARLSITDLRQKTLSIQVRGEISQTLPLIKSAKPCKISKKYK